MKNRRKVALALILAMLLPLAGCQKRDDKALAERFQQMMEGKWLSLESKVFVQPPVWREAHQEKIEAYGGYGGSVAYALYETAPKDPDPDCRYFYLREAGPEGPIWTAWRMEDTALSHTTALPAQPKDAQPGRLVGEFSVTLQTVDLELPRPETDYEALEQIEGLLASDDFTLPAGGWGGEKGLAYVNTQELYAVVVTGKGDWGELDDYPLLYDTAYLYRFSREDGGTLKVAHTEEFGGYHGEGELNSWFYYVAQADVVAHIG